MTRGEPRRGPTRDGAQSRSECERPRVHAKWAARCTGRTGEAIRASISEEEAFETLVDIDMFDAGRLKAGEGQEESNDADVNSSTTKDGGKAILILLQMRTTRLLSTCRCRAELHCLLTRAGMLTRQGVASSSG